MNKVGWPEKDDMQSLDDINGVQRAVRFVSPDGKRQDTAHQYLHPLLQGGSHPNLHVVCQATVDRVIFDGTTATGLVFRRNPGFADRPPLKRTVLARKLVVVSCGALGTPSVLERSGVGSPDILKRAGVRLVADLPGVGNDYQDHQLCLYAYKTSLKPEDTFDLVVQGKVKAEDLIQEKSPLLGYNAQDVTCKLRPSDKEVAALGPAFQRAWDQYYKVKPDKPLVLMSPING